MPLVTIRTGFLTPEGQEEILTEYLCDWPGCPNVAAHMLGCIPDIRLKVVVCEEHVRSAQRRTSA